VGGASPFQGQAPVRDLLGQRVLEGVLEIGEELRLVEELGGLQRVERRSQDVLGASTSACRSVKGTSLPITAAL
jgi:hypothetical protein